MNFLDQIFRRLGQESQAVLLQEIRDGQIVSTTGADLLSAVNSARGFLRGVGLKKGDRCALVAPNSIRWVALDLAIMAEGIVAVPLYSRQAAAELVAMMKDCTPALVVCGDHFLADNIAPSWPDAPRLVTLEEVFATEGEIEDTPANPAESDPLAIIYTSGTSGEAKGVVFGVANIHHMLTCTSERLDTLMSGSRGQDRVFHYLPFCFAGSWIMLLTCLVRGSMLTMSTDLGKLATDMRAASAHYFLNVPVLLERMRTGVDEQLRKTGGFANAIYAQAKEAWYRRDAGEPANLDAVWLGLARKLVFPTIRKKMIGANLRALICGSAPLARDTQLFFSMLGIPVLQVYGLTETTAICTMDDPRSVEPGRVGPAIPGIEMKLGENDEILVRGPNIFLGYWNRPQATAEAMRDGWFHTGDQGDVNRRGNWRISGRVKNLIILSSGHNVAPEPVEDALLRLLPDAHQVVLVGHGRGFISAVVTGKPTAEQVQWAIDEVNRESPHYKRVHAFHIEEEPFTPDNGLLTANGKLKRDAIADKLRNAIERLYANSEARVG